MSAHGVKLAVSFGLSLVLHGAVLWAVAARIEPRQAEQPSEVEILDRDLFFRHAPARKVERTAPVSAGERVMPRESSVAVESEAAPEAMAPAAVHAARQHTPEQRLSATRHADPARPVPGEAVRPVPQPSDRIEPDSQSAVARPVDDEPSLAGTPADERLSARAHDQRARQAQPRDTLAAAPSEERLAGAGPGPVAAAAAVDRAALAPPHDRLAPNDRETLQVRPAGPGDRLAAALSEQRLDRADHALDAEPAENADSLTAVAPGGRVSPAERDVPDAPPARPAEAMAAASAEQRLTRAEVSRDAVRSEAVDILASVPAAPADSGIAVMRQPEAAPRVSLQPRRATAARQSPSRRAPVAPGETAEPVRHSAATARSTPPVAVPAEPATSDQAPVVAERLAPDTPTAEAMVLVGKPVEAVTSRTVERGQAETAASAPVAAARRSRDEPIRPEAVTGTPLARGDSERTMRPVAPQTSLQTSTPDIALTPEGDTATAQERRRAPERLAARQSAEPVDSGPVTTLAPASDTATAQERPRAPERVAALQAAEPVDSKPATTVAPARVAATAQGRPRAPERLAVLQPNQPVDSGPAATVAPTRADGTRLAPASAVRSNTTRARRIARASPQAAAPASQPTPTLAPAPAGPETRTPAAATPQRLAAIDPAERFTRTYKGGDCFLAVPRASAQATEIVSYAAELESVLSFKEAFAQAIDIEPSLGWQSITDAQCGGISFARVILGNRAPSLAIELDRQQIESGGALSGRLPEQPFANVAMLLVDDDGLVHNISRFLRPGPDGLELFIPQLHAIRDGKRRVHLLMAVSASTKLPALESADGEAIHADDFFSQLLDQVRAADAQVEIGLDHFVVF